MNKLLTRGVLMLMLACVVGIPALSQKNAQREKSHDSLSCRDDWQNDRLVNHCEIKEQTLPASDNTIAVDGRMNGGVSIKGWERNEILMRARIQTAAPTEAEANELAKEVKIELLGQRFCFYPEIANHLGVSATKSSCKVFNQSLKTNSGGISISDVKGQLEFMRWNVGSHLSHRRNRRGGTPMALAHRVEWRSLEAILDEHNQRRRFMSIPRTLAHLETELSTGI